MRIKSLCGRACGWAAQLLVLATVVYSPPALAYFDIVSLYQQKVKSFEAVYFLKEDKEWKRDRRIFEFFFSGDRILQEESGGEVEKRGYTNLSGGLLINARPGKGGDIQVSLFNLWSGNQMGIDDMEIWEALNGGRITYGEIAELSLGSYWRSSKAAWDPGDSLGDEGLARRKASGFMELNSPMLFLKSSYVFGLGEKSGLDRWDLRFDYDHLTWVDSLTLGVVQYNFAEKRTLGGLDVTRLGFPKFRFLSGQLRISRDGLAWGEAGLDLLLQSGEDFNLTRRGHFSTSLGFKAMYSYVSPDGASIIGRPGEQGQHGVKLKLTAQVPAKWVMLILVTIGAGMSGRPEDHQAAMRMAENVAREPRDILFCRVEFEYSYNAPETFLFPVPDIVDRHRLFLSLGFMY